MQLLVTARDTGNPDIVVSESVQINVLRNLFAPVFGQASYSASVYDYASVGSSVVQVDATDSDITVRHWAMSGLGVGVGGRGEGGGWISQDRLI